MKTIFVWLVAASWLLAACGPQTAATPEVVSNANICVTGTEFTPGDEIDLGETAEFSAVLSTSPGYEPTATLVITLPDGGFSPSGGVLPKDGKLSTFKWGTRVIVRIGNCSGRYYYEANVAEVVEPERDVVCGAGFGGPTKPWPFLDEVLLFRPGTGEEVWLITGMNQPILLPLFDGGLAGDPVAVDRPLDGKRSLTILPLSGGASLYVTIKNCSQTLYYNAAWVSGR